MSDYLDTFIDRLLHAEDVNGNRLVDIAGGGQGKAFRLFCADGSPCKTMLQCIAERRGKPSNKTVLEDSALVRVTVRAPSAQKWDWSDLYGERNAQDLDKFISNTYGAIAQKGNNPLFLGVGALSISVAVGNDIRRITSPILVFPIRLVRGSNTSPVEIEFPDDDAYFNPCLIALLRNGFASGVAAGFPHPNGGSDFDAPIALEKLGDGAEYFARLGEYVRSLDTKDDDGIRLDSDALFVAQYNHSDFCMYYDVRRNREKIYAHPLVRRVFSQCGAPSSTSSLDFQEKDIRSVLPMDSVQQKIVERIASGESLVIKGPPGTGKTVTIANIAATLLADGKRVLIASEKISALAEVYAKLPERLRKFVMLLDYETEQKAAAVNPTEVKADLKRLLKDRAEYSYDNACDIKYGQAERAQAEAAIGLKEYCDDVFSQTGALGSLYDALDGYFGYESLPSVDIASNGDIAGITRDEYNILTLAVKDGAAYYSVMARDGGISNCPWYGIRGDTQAETAFSDMCALGRDTDAFLQSLRPFTEKCKTLPWDDITLGNIVCAGTPNAFDKSQLQKLSDIGDYCKKELIDSFGKYDGQKTGARLDVGFVVSPNGIAAIPPESPNGATIAEVCRMGTLTTCATKVDGECAIRFTKVIAQIVQTIALRDSATARAKAVFADKMQDAASVAQECADCLKKYVDGKRTVPKLFDFKAKNAVRKLLPLCVAGESASLSELAAGCVAAKQCQAYDGEIKSLTTLAASIIGLRELSDCVSEAAFTAIKYVGERGNIFEFAGECERIAAVIKSEVISPFDDSITLGELFAAAKAQCAAIELKECLSRISEKSGVDIPDDFYNAAKSVVMLHGAAIGRDNKYGPELIELFSNERGTAAGIQAQSIVEKYREFGAKHFYNAYTAEPYGVTLKMAATLCVRASDRSVIGAALGYLAVKSDSKLPISLESFFCAAENGECGDPTMFADVFARAVFKAIVEDRLSDIGAMRNGFGKRASALREKLFESQASMRECNVQKIEKLCMARLNPDDPDYDFLNADRGIPQSLRVMFAKNAAAITKLKRCFILSPSTASVLFRGEAYENFDAVIVDEASQMEPVDLLPVLFRAKQCILVGDEFQMPPLVHFQTKNRSRIFDPESELTVDGDISALGLALGNLAFDTAELVCHYRSKTEELIEFSQRRFYPYMRTFPTVQPATEELGFEDVLAENGYCEDGVNSAEAMIAAQKLDEHFQKYYNRESGELSRSVGVVAFGEAQLQQIKNIVAKDKRLSQDIEQALKNFDDLPEKKIFFRTIESVQGQETEHLILSLTYGRDKDGNIRQSFGELNRDAVGNNIFNVAVTRAQCKITVIHSVTAEQISSNPRIAFIKDYLDCSRRFANAQVGSAVFVSSQYEKGGGFIRSIVGYLESRGIKKERIVVGYGITKGSVRIPIAVLSPKLDKAELGIIAELPTLNKYDYADYNIRYPHSLAERGWRLHDISACEWYDNRDAECRRLAAVLSECVTSMSQQ